MKSFSPLHLLLLLLYQVALSRADVAVSSPAPSQTFSASGGAATVALTWIDDGISPSVDQATSFSFILCTGSNSQITAVVSLAEAQAVQGNAYTATVPSTAGADGVYYIQIVAVYPSGHSIRYSRRFRLAGMTGSVKPVGALSDAPPAGQVSFNADPAATTVDHTATMDVSRSFSVPYTLQTGIYKFAPMQSQPSNTVTATTWSRHFPTSAVTYYSTIRPSPNCASTITPGWSYARTSVHNYASALGTPSVWYHPSKKIKKPTISITPTATPTRQKRFWDLD